MQDYEKLGVFYLGKPVDPISGKALDEPLLYQSKDLLTHAVCVGMTGSGKTGLCIGLLEEAAIDGIPALVIDPKGDLSNLLLTFPELRPEDFRPWVNEDEARTKGQTADQFAALQADLWRQGLAGFSQNGARIARLKAAADFAIYTPGSNAGIPLSILKSFDPPEALLASDREATRERIAATVTSLLGLAAIDADPIASREHILLSNIFDSAWREGRRLPIADLIASILNPPFTKLGVLDLDTFFPAKDRFTLAMAFNNLIASPGFGAWLEGEPLDIGRLLWTAEGKPRVAILSIAHMSDAERMFFVSLLLNQVLGWVRTQPGTTSLRAILYMDEIFGYFPPVANPPSKKPLLTLLKQARAYGLGLVLATQNPVDLDYKGLSNAGTWFIGRLQTERDRMRVLDGLEAAAGEAQATFSRVNLQQMLAKLASRTFLMNNVHDGGVSLFQTRWTLSYLRGPLTKSQVARLMEGRKPQPDVTPAVASAAETSAITSAAPPVLPPAVSQYFLPVRRMGSAVYTPVILGAAKIRFLDVKRGIDELRTVVFLTGIGRDPVPVSWEEANLTEIGVEELEREPLTGAGFAELPPPAAKISNYKLWTKSFTNWLFQAQSVAIYRSQSLDRCSSAGESERDFRIRLSQMAREERDRQAEELRRKYAPKQAVLEDRKHRAELAEQGQKSQRSQAVLQSLVNVGTGVLGAFLGKRTNASSVLSKAGTAWKESQDVGRAAENVEQVVKRMAELQQQFDADLAGLTAKLDPATELFETVTIRPKKTNIEVQLVSLAWQVE